MERHKRLLRRCAEVLAMLLAALLALPVSVGSSQTPSATPQQPEITGVNGSLTWLDNSDNEDGFRVEITINGELSTFVVIANATSFEIPANLAEQCGDRRYNVVAFNDAGESPSRNTVGGILECPGVLETPTPQLLLPTTGKHGMNDLRTAPALITLTALGSALFATSAIVLILGKKR
jgi:hypothetical protein